MIATAVTGRFSAWVVAALALTALGAVLSLIALAVPLTTPAARPAFQSTALLAVLAVLPALTAAATAFWRGPIATCGVLSGAGTFVLGQGIGASQVALDATTATRPELLAPRSLEMLHAATGSWLLLAGYALTVLGAVAAVLGVRSAQGGHADSGAAGSRLLPVGALTTGVVAALALVALEPFGSSDALLPGNTLLDTPPMALAGGIVVVLGALFGPLLATTNASSEAAGGGLLGCAVGFALVALPQLVTGMAAAGASVSTEPVLVLLAALALALLAATVWRAGNEAADDETEQLELPELRRLHRGAGLCAVLAGIAALLVTAVPLIQMPAGLPPLEGLGQGSLAVAGVVVVVAGALLLWPRVAATIRPAFLVTWTVLPMAATVLLDSVLTATKINGVHAQVGAWLIGAAMVLVLVAACAGAVAGGVERDEVDLSDQPVRVPVVAVAAVGAASTVASLGVPVIVGTDYLPAGLWSNFRIGSWGLVAAAVAVIAAVVIAARSRPSRASSLLCGAAVIPAMRALDYPLNHGEVPDSQSGAGLWLAVAACVVLLVAALCSRTFSRANVPA